MLVLLLPVAGPFGSVSVDEGAAAHQALHLERGDGWSVAPPISAIDEEHLLFPITKSEPTADGWAPFARHPLYAVGLAAAARSMGDVGMVLWSLLGTVLAAVGAAQLALTFSSRRVAIATCWVTGLASPLVFDSYLLIAHSLGAAAVAWALVALSTQRSQGRRGWSWAPAALVVITVGIGTMLRAEVVLVALAATLVRGYQPILARRVGDALMAATPVIGSALGLVAEARWRAAIGVRSTGLGGPSARASSDRLDWLTSRLDGLTASVWSVGHTRGAALVALSCALLVASALVARLGQPRIVSDVLAVLAVVVLAARLVLFDARLVPQLLVAFPLILVAGVVGWGRSELADGKALLWIGLVAAGLIVLTQYPEGGAVEWGGRYFAVLIPLAVPLALHALWSVASADRGHRTLLGALGVTMALMSTLAMSALRDANRRADRVLEAIGETASPARLASDPGDDRPVIVTSEFGVPRLDWRRFDDRRWVYLGPPSGEDDARDPQIADLARDLTGERLVTLVSEDVRTDLRRLGPHEVVGPARTIGPFTLLEVTLAG